jgi:hypothetical protein
MGNKMMDLYFLEFLIKEKEQQLLEESKRIQILRARRNPGVRFLKNFILKFGEILFALGARFKNRYRASIKPSTSGHDCC